MPILRVFPAIVVGPHAADVVETVRVVATVQLIGGNRYRLIRVEPVEEPTDQSRS